MKITLVMKNKKREIKWRSCLCRDLKAANRGLILSLSPKPQSNQKLHLRKNAESVKRSREKRNKSNLSASSKKKLNLAQMMKIKTTQLRLLTGEQTMKTRKAWMMTLTVSLCEGKTMMKLEMKIPQCTRSSSKTCRP